MFAIILPLLTHIYLFQYHKDKPQFNSVSEAKQVEIVSVAEECNKVKYGMFSNGTDTIVRYTENGKDYQQIKFLGHEQLYRITWISPCEYLVIEQVSSVSKYIKLGNFDGLNHYTYSKSPSTYKFKEETMEYLLTLRTD